MAKHAYQKHGDIYLRRKPYASEQDAANLNAAIIHLRNAKEATNSTLFDKELRAAMFKTRAVWQAQQS